MYSTTLGCECRHGATRIDWQEKQQLPVRSNCGEEEVLVNLGGGGRVDADVRADNTVVTTGAPAPRCNGGATPIAAPTGSVGGIGLMTLVLVLPFTMIRLRRSMGDGRLSENDAPSGGNSREPSSSRKICATRRCWGFEQCISRDNVTGKADVRKAY